VLEGVGANIILVVVLVLEVIPYYHRKISFNEYPVKRTTRAILTVHYQLYLKRENANRTFPLKYLHFGPFPPSDPLNMEMANLSYPEMLKNFKLRRLNSEI
jgi:hypothetical protein